MESARYRLSFTAGGLLQQESVQLAQLYLDLKDWTAVRDKALSDNILQARTVNTSKRFCREIISRLKMLSSGELDLLVQGSIQEQAQLLWVSLCRRYQFIADFAVEVLHEKHRGLQPDLQHADFDSFFNHKSEWHSELEAIKPSTRNKLRQVLFKILQDADLLSGAYTITPALISPRVDELLKQGNAQDLLLFPVNDPEQQRRTP
ncbi:DUF1819 family protein [Allochromatium palmeri]|uniref:DUF1819 family protein n=1 Tax=Allochromatium palmeri TaxID=231048 RepID=A0A6N8EGK3_9GAMM|nr:DUF1819 family protein [Allochromatium palmeri]MTW21826.1 DUF1819 family protein [Allochromatium palmeri]